MPPAPDDFDLALEFFGPDPESPDSVPPEVCEYVRRGLLRQGVSEEEIDIHFPLLRRPGDPVREVDAAWRAYRVHPRPGQPGFEWDEEYEARHRRLLFAIGVSPENVEDYCRRRFPSSFEGFSVVDGRLTDEHFHGEADHRVTGSLEHIHAQLRGQGMPEELIQSLWAE